MAGSGKHDALDLSARDLAEAAKRAPDHPPVHRWMGYRHYVAGDYAGAAAAWRRALELDPGLRADLEPEIADAERRK